MSFKKSFFKNVLIFGSYNNMALLLPFLFSPITFRWLPPEVQGTVGLINVFIGFFSVFSDGGISFALIRSDYGLRYQKALNNLAWLIGLVLCVLTILLAYPISLFYNNITLFWPTIALSFTFLIRSFSLTQGAMLAKNLKFNYIGFVALICSVVTVALTILLAHLNFQHWSIIIPQLVTALLTVVLYERKAKLGFKLSPKKDIIVALRLSKKLLGNVLGFNIINYWARNADNLIVGKLYGEGPLGIYNNAYKLLSLPLAFIQAPFNTILLPSLKKLKNQNGSIESEYLFICKALATIAFPVMVLFLFFSEPLIGIVWGSSWLGVAELLPYFGIAFFPQAILSSAGSVLVAEHKEQLYFRAGLVNSTIYVAFIAIGAFYSLKSIAAMYSLGCVALVLPFSIYYIYIYGLNFDTKKTLYFWLPKLICSIAIWVAVYFNHQPLLLGAVGVLAIHLALNIRKGIKQFITSIKSYMQSSKGHGKQP